MFGMIEVLNWKNWGGGDWGRESSRGVKEEEEVVVEVEEVVEVEIGWMNLSSNWFHFGKNLARMKLELEDELPEKEAVEIEAWVAVKVVLGSIWIGFWLWLSE